MSDDDRAKAYTLSSLPALRSAMRTNQPSPPYVLPPSWYLGRYMPERREDPNS